MKNGKEQKKHSVLLYRTGKNARTFRSFEKNGCPTLSFCSQNFEPGDNLCCVHHILRRQSLRCGSYRWVKGSNLEKKLLGVYPTAKSISAVCIIPWRWSPQYASHSGDNRNQIRKYFSLFIRGPDGLESWKKWMSKISWHTPFKSENYIVTIAAT